MLNNKNITLGQLVDLAAQVDERLDALEACAPVKRDLTLTASGWTNDSGDAKYPYQYRLTVKGVTEASRADAMLDADSVDAASGRGVWAASETAADTVIFKSRTAPTVDLTGVLYIKWVAAWSGAQ